MRLGLCPSLDQILRRIPFEPRNVALRLLEDAAEADPLIADAFYVEEI